GQPAHFSVTRQASRATGNLPSLWEGRAILDDLEIERRAGGADERGVSLCFIPLVAYAIDTGVVLDDEARLQATPRGGVAAFEFEIEVLDPHRTGRQGPVAVRLKTKAA